MMKKLVALFLVLCTTGCATTGLRQSALRETPPGHTAPVPTPSTPDITSYADLLGTSTEKVQKIFGTPDSVGIISAGKECFGRMRYWNIRFMGKPADLEIDEHHQEVTQVKIKLASMPAAQKQEVIKEITEEFLPKHDEYSRTSQPGYQWKDKKGNIVSFSYANPSLEIGYTSENWLKFLSGETVRRLPVAETEPGDMFADSTKETEPGDIVQEELTESGDIVQEELEHLEPAIEEARGSEAVTSTKDKGPGISFEEVKAGPGEESTPTDLQKGDMLEKEELTSSEYNITGVEKIQPTIKEAPYHWRVQAIDGAFNKSEWTPPGLYIENDYDDLPPTSKPREALGKWDIGKQDVGRWIVSIGMSLGLVGLILLIIRLRR